MKDPNNHVARKKNISQNQSPMDVAVKEIDERNKNWGKLNIKMSTRW